MNRAEIFAETFKKKFNRECPHEYIMIWKEISEDYHFAIAMEEYSRLPAQWLPMPETTNTKNLRSVALENAVKTFPFSAEIPVPMLLERCDKIFRWLINSPENDTL